MTTPAHAARGLISRGRRRLSGTLGWPAAAAAVILAVTPLACVAELSHAAQSDRARLRLLAARLDREVQLRLAASSYELIAARTVFSASKSVEREEFRALAESRDVHQYVPGAMGLGFIRRVPRADLPAFLERTRGDGAPGYEIRRDAGLDELRPVEFFRPRHEDMAVLGMDFAGDPAFTAAADDAVAADEERLSAPLAAAPFRSDGWMRLLLLPVYANGSPTGTPAERRAACQGWVFMPLSPELIFAGAEAAVDGEARLRVLAGPAHAAPGLVHDTTPGAPPGGRGLPAPESGTFDAAGLRWTVVAEPSGRFDRASRAGAWMLGVGGAGLSCALILLACQGGSLAQVREGARRIAASLDVAYAHQATTDAQLRDAVDRLAQANHELLFRQRGLDEHAIVAITDARGRITHVNDNFCRISGYSRDELLGQDHRLINSGHHPKAFFRDMYATIARGQIWRGDLRNRAKDGSAYWVKTTIIPDLDPAGKVIRYMAVRDDITYLKRVEEEQRDAVRALRAQQQELNRKNAELEQFVYTVSHDLKTPIVTVLGFAAHARLDCDRGDAAKLLEDLDRITRAASRLKDHIDELLELSRVGRVIADPEPVELAPAIDEALDLCQGARPGPHVRVELALACPTVLADRPRLLQILQNLISNAFKYACAGPDPVVEIATEDLGDAVCLSVRDHGPGIAPEHHERIFGLFQRLGTGAEGSGVGLALVRRIAEVHGGRAWVESSLGRGAAFRVTFPKSGITRTAELSFAGVEDHAAADTHADRPLPADRGR